VFFGSDGTIVSEELFEELFLFGSLGGKYGAPAAARETALDGVAGDDLFAGISDWACGQYAVRLVCGDLGFGWHWGLLLIGRNKNRPLTR
jgi:hypothetical protein